MRLLKISEILAEYTDDPNNSRDMHDRARGALCSVDPQAFDASGVPLYDADAVRAIVNNVPNRLELPRVYLPSGLSSSDLTTACNALRAVRPEFGIALVERFTDSATVSNGAWWYTRTAAQALGHSFAANSAIYTDRSADMVQAGFAKRVA